MSEALVLSRPALRPHVASREPIVIAAGGTGGHFFPAEATASELAARGYEITLMCDARSGGLNSAVFADRPTFVLSGAGIAGRGVVRAAKAAGALMVGTAQACSILRKLAPSAIVAFGGYPSVAPVVGASLLRDRPKLVLHEQNAVLGRANRWLARRADVLALSIEGTRSVPAGTPVVVTGNPVRVGIAALQGHTYEALAEEIRICVLGGSLGARVLSDVVPAALACLPEALRASVRIVQQCRAEDLDRVRAAYAAAGIHAELAVFFPCVEQKLAAAHLVISRAGASTVAELAVVGLPSILVPLPGAIDDHQTANAAALVDAGAAWLMPQTQFQSGPLAALIEQLAGAPGKLAQAASRAASIGHADAAGRLADLVERTIGRASRA